jgi:glucan phosphoethanolaminetransferase (alkaline phosphatase superfamily)
MLRFTLLSGKYRFDLSAFGKRLWELRWAILLNLYLLSPILVYEFKWTEGGPDKCTFFLLAASLLWLFLVQAIGRRLWVTHAILFPFYLCVGMDLFVIHYYRTRLSSSMLLVVHDNLSDAPDFLRIHATPVVVIVAATLSAYGFALWKLRKQRFDVPRGTVLACVVVLVASYGETFRRANNFTRLAATDRGSPFGVIPQAYVSYRVAKASLESAKLARNFRFNATRPTPPAQPELHVVVIGESSRPDHWGLYGYARDTNPLLGKTDNLIVFRDVLSQSALTKEAVPLLLTRGDIRNLKATSGERSVISLFREVGFHTLWYSAQLREPSTGNINRNSSEAHDQRFIDRRHDMVLVNMLKDYLAGTGKNQDRLLVVIHTQGNHFTYSSRYPREFAKFRDSGPGLSYRDQLVNSYDNAVAYTDFVLHELITLLRGRPGIKTLFYWGDHGENLEDDERKLNGHLLNNEYDLPIPAVFWYSPEFASRVPALVAAARRNASARINSKSAFCSFAHLAGIEFNDPNLSRFSVFSDAMDVGPRMVAGPNGPRDFDVWRSEQKLAGPAPSHAQLQRKGDDTVQ